jgi:nitroreductase/dihydropteridine reductase
METIIQALQKRYAVKQFDKSFKLSTEQVSQFKEIANLTATSMGLQPFRVAMISSDEVKEKLLTHSYNQPQITSASHLFVLCAVENVDDNYADKYLDNIAKTRGVTRESLKGYEQMVKGFTSQDDTEMKTQWAARQAYIVVGNLLTSAAMAGIDACPMEGFDADAYAEVLGLKAKGLRPYALVALGKKSQDDKYATAAKVRMPVDELFIEY